VDRYVSRFAGLGTRGLGVFLVSLGTGLRMEGKLFLTDHFDVGLICYDASAERALPLAVGVSASLRMERELLPTYGRKVWIVSDDSPAKRTLRFFRQFASLWYVAAELKYLWPAVANLQGRITALQTQICVVGFSETVGNPLEDSSALADPLLKLVNDMEAGPRAKDRSPVVYQAQSRVQVPDSTGSLDLDF